MIPGCSHPSLGLGLGRGWHLLSPSFPSCNGPDPGAQETRDGGKGSAVFPLGPSPCWGRSLDTASLTLGTGLWGPHLLECPTGLPACPGSPGLPCPAPGALFTRTSGSVLRAGRLHEGLREQKQSRSAGNRDLSLRLLHEAAPLPPPPPGAAQLEGKPTGLSQRDLCGRGK